MRTVTIEPLTAAGWAPFGELLEGGLPDRPMRSANQGTARVWDRLVSLENRRPQAALNASVFRCEPRRLPLDVVLLERHPSSAQLFVPMNARRFLVVVAPGEERPDTTGLRAFLAHPTQGICYRPGTWHHPMIALDAPIDFGCFVWEDGTPGDCEIVELDPSEQVRVA